MRVCHEVGWGGESIREKSGSKFHWESGVGFDGGVTSTFIQPTDSNSDRKQ